MNKRELIKALKKFDDYSALVVGDDETGWSNIEEIRDSGSFISIMVEGSKPLPADQEKNFIYSLNFKKLIMKLINHFLTIFITRRK